MHFWIDKRSQQCGFGRSRVAASLSGAGGSGVGLSFGHPPRRISGGSGNKANSRSNVLPDCHHSTAASSSGSRSHQYQQAQLQHHHQLQQQQYANNNNNFNSGNNCQQSNTHSSNNINYTDTFNTANATASGATMQSTTSATLNNNPQQYTYQQTHQHGSGSMRTHHAPGNNNLMSNNNISTSTSTATGTDVRGITPATQDFNQRAGALLQNNADIPNAPLYQQHVNQGYDMRSYHHPQFGNMSVRHYQYSGRNCNGPTHVNSNTPTHAYRNGNNSGARTIVGAAHSQHMDQMTYRQQHNRYSLQLCN